MSEWSGRPPGKAATRDGWHWLARRDGAPGEVFLWRPDDGWLSCFSRDGLGWMPASAVAVRGWRYLDPCLTPAEVAAAVAAEREACAAVCEERAAIHNCEGWNPDPPVTQEAMDCAAAIRARASGGDALAEHIARVRREALEEAASIARAAAAAIGDIDHEVAASDLAREIERMIREAARAEEARDG